MYRIDGHAPGLEWTIAGNITTLGLAKEQLKTLIKLADGRLHQGGLKGTVYKNDASFYGLEINKVA